MSILGCVAYEHSKQSSVSDRIKEHFENVLRETSALYQLDEKYESVVKDIAIGPKFIGILTDTGRLGRVPYELNADDLPKKGDCKSSQPARTRFSENSSSAGGSSLRSIVGSNYFADMVGSFIPRFGSEQTYALTRRVPTRTVEDVPEPLIEQVQNVLQGHSRNVVARALLQHQLNVNLTINYLLNAEDDHAELYDISANEPNVVIIPAESDQSISVVPRTVLPLRTPAKTKPKTESKIDHNTTINFYWNDIQWIDEVSEFSNTKFKIIGAMFSDLVAIDVNGAIYQWPWNFSYFIEQEHGMGIHYHQKAKALNFPNDKIIDFSCSFSRACAVLASNKVVSFMDSSLTGVSHLENCIYISPESKELKVKKVCVNNLYTVALLEDNSLYWWGALTNDYRNKIMLNESKRTKSKKDNDKKIELGSFVTSRTNGVIPIGSLAYYCDNLTLKMGKLNEPISSSRTSAKFIPLSSGKSTNTSELNEKKTDTPQKTNRKRKHSIVTNSLPEELWDLKNVVFVYEQANEIGQVVKIDHDNVLVEFKQYRRVHNRSPQIRDVCKLKNISIVKINELRVVKHCQRKKNFPQCQNTPKRLEYSKNIKVIGLCSGEQSVNVLIRYQDTNKYSRDVIIPGFKMCEFENFSARASSIIPQNVDLVDMCVVSDILIIGVPKSNSTSYTIFSRDWFKVFSPLELPTIPDLSLIRSHWYGKSEFHLFFYIFSHSATLSSEDSLLANFSIDNTFYKGRNVLHMLASLCFISEVSFQSVHVDSLLNKIKELVQSSGIEKVKSLLVQKDFDGFTPFLYSIKIKSYKFALFIYNFISGIQDSAFTQQVILNESIGYVFNPLYLLCTNENCTYTWTKDVHIAQDIYECKTCGVFDNLCLCSECMISCHRGHECVRKERSPSAFCDCWQKCVCNSLVSGDQNSRKYLFRVLINETFLLNHIGYGNEHLLIVVVRSYSRQIKTYKDFTNMDLSKKDKHDNNDQESKLNRQNVHGFPIKHLKRPSKFLIFALKLLLSTKEVINTLFSTKKSHNADPENVKVQNIPYFLSTQHLIPSQTCGKLYDQFLYTLFTKGEKAITGILHKTLRKNFSDQPPTFDQNDCHEALVNFVRSCIRLYIVIQSTMAPIIQCEASKREPQNNDNYRVLYRLVMFFKLFPLTTVTQMCNIALSIISPIIYGSVSQKPNSHPLFSKMSDVNDYVSGFFSSLQTPVSSIKPKKATTGRNTVLINAENLITSQNPHEEEETTYSEDDDDDDDDDEEEEEEQDDFDSEDTEYTVYSDEINFDTENAVGFSPRDITHTEVFEFPTINEVTYDSRDTSPSEPASTRPRANVNANADSSRRRLSSPLAAQSSNRRENEAASTYPYYWAVRHNNDINDTRNEVMSALRNGGTEFLNEGNALMMNNVSGLARSFMIAIKVIADLCVHANFFDMTDIVKKLFNPTIGQVFLWLFDTCERIEAKLRFGMSSIVNSVPNLQSGRWDYDFTQRVESQSNEMNVPSSRMRRRAEDRNASHSNKNRTEFLSNLVSLMRSHNNDHEGILPYLDLSSCRHIAFLLDAMSYFLAALSSSSSLSATESFVKLGEYSLILQNDVTQLMTRKFFSRTSSTLSFSHFTQLLTPVEESFPLALNPTILTTSVTKKSLFNTSEYDITKDSITNSKYDFSSFSLFSSALRFDFIDDILKSSPSVFYVRWYHIFDIFAQVFSDSIACEPSSVFREICRFEAKETSFRSLIEKSRSSVNTELNLDHIDRRSEKLIVQTFKILNNSFQKKTNSKGREALFSRMKVSFKNEPGEGSGVTRNFFSAIFDVIKNIEKLPDLTPILDTNAPSNSNKAPAGNTSAVIPAADMIYTATDIFDDNGEGRDMLIGRLNSFSRNRLPVNLVSRSERTLSDTFENPRSQVFGDSMYIRPPSTTTSSQSNVRGMDALRVGHRGGDRDLDNSRIQIVNSFTSFSDRHIPNSRRTRTQSQMPTSSRNRRITASEETLPITLAQIEEMASYGSDEQSSQFENRLRLIIKKKISKYISSELVHSVLESIMQLSPDVIFTCIQDDEFLKSKAESIIKLIDNVKEKFKVTYGFMDTSVYAENAQLFFQPGKQGFYFPVNGKKTFLRLNAYKNVGRLIGLALFFNELIPFILCRPVIKFLLDRPISFHDFAFYDPIQYESLRMLKLEGQNYRQQFPNETVNMHDLTYCLTVQNVEGKPHTIELIPGGYQTNVTSYNVDHYIKAYVEYLLIHSVKSELEAMREGMSEVVTPFSLRLFSPEDFRLLLNGTFNVSMALLRKLVTFSDETAQLSPEKVQKFKAWFWEVVESFDEQQRSELLLFWTSSSLLSETQINPKPNVVLKAASEHLPTSNTCVMRLYLPVYPKKSILKAKLLTAIKTKSFGFI